MEGAGIMATIFLELNCEEIPALMQKKAVADLEILMQKALGAHGFEGGTYRAVISPRHMAIEVGGLADRLSDSLLEKRGPRTDAPDKAIAGFCQSAGISREDLTTQTTPKGEFYFARRAQKGAVLADIAPQIVRTLLSDFPWPKSQRWGHSDFAWIRPLRRINLLLDGQAIAGEFDLGGGMQIAFGDETEAHPFYTKTLIKLFDFDRYVQDMRDAHVMVDHIERRQFIERDLKKNAAENNVQLNEDDILLDEITGLVEWPNVIAGRIDEEFMTLPREVLITSMRVHQKFFALSAPDDISNPAPFFLTVANRKASAKNDALIRAGNERVLRARLADAQFFWRQDLAIDQETARSKLSAVTFYEGLGTMADKADRMQKLAREIAHMLGDDPEAAARAALLAKTDLTSSMVGEFPELQGIMGGYYAKAQGEDVAIAEAIAQHYRPQGPSDTIPDTRLAQIVALADKIDTLVGFFGIGKRPTGSGDPFALRRAALGIIRIVRDAEFTLNLETIFTISAKIYGFDTDVTKFDTTVVGQLSAFMIDRLRVCLRDIGYAHDVIEASFHTGRTFALVGIRNVDILVLYKKVEVVTSFLATEKGQASVTNWRRISSIIDTDDQHILNIGLFKEDAEKQLYNKFSEVERRLRSVDDLGQTLLILSELSAPIDRFFEKVIVNSDDHAIRNNRQALLKTVYGIVEPTFCFELLAG